MPIVSLLLAAAIVLDAHTACPSEAAVRASLAGLGVDANDRQGSATWTLDDSALTLTVLTASTATAAARVFPIGSCAELADQVALAIERATTPLDASPPAERVEPTASVVPVVPVASVEKKSSTTLAVHLGAGVLFLDHTAFAWSLGADVWPWGAAFGVLALVQGTAPSTFESGRATLELTRYTIGLGLGMRRRLTDGIEAGVDVSAILEHLRGTPGGLNNPTPIRDFRFGARAGGFGRMVLFDPVYLGLDVHLRVVSERNYRAIPATELVVLHGFELETGLNIGAIFF